MQLKLACFSILSGFMRLVWFLLKPIHSRSPHLRNAVSNAIRLSPFLQRLVARKFGGTRYADFEASADKHEILVDITHVYKNDLRTGIQRVVRSVLAGLEAEKAGSVEPVYLTDAGGFWHYRYVNRPDAKMVVPKRADFFLGLDLNSNVIAAEAGGLFDDWKSRGARISFVVYDILPLEHPEWWEPAVSVGHELWLRTILRLSDDVVCISKSVLDSVKDWANKSGYVKQDLPNMHWFHLGADVESSIPTVGLPDNTKLVLDRLKIYPTFLMVGTIEPRKGYAQTLSAFEILWGKGLDVNLVVVGKKGWMVNELVNKITSHPEFGTRFFWIQNASDEYLRELYKASTCLIVASEGEGFGLPIIEGAMYGLPIIARDIPVFNEVAGESAFYFKGLASNDLAKVVSDWLEYFADGNFPKPDGITWLTWRESVKCLMLNLNLDSINN